MADPKLQALVTATEERAGWEYQLHFIPPYAVTEEEKTAFIDWCGSADCYPQETWYELVVVRCNENFAAEVINTAEDTGLVLQACGPTPVLVTSGDDAWPLKTGTALSRAMLSNLQAQQSGNPCAYDEANDRIRCAMAMVIGDGQGHNYGLHDGATAMMQLACRREGLTQPDVDDPRHHRGDDHNGQAQVERLETLGLLTYDDAAEVWRSTVLVG